MNVHGLAKHRCSNKKVVLQDTKKSQMCEGASCATPYHTWYARLTSKWKGNNSNKVPAQANQTVQAPNMTS